MSCDWKTYGRLSGVSAAGLPLLLCLFVLVGRNSLSLSSCFMLHDSRRQGKRDELPGKPVSLSSSAFPLCVCVRAHRVTTRPAGSAFISSLRICACCIDIYIHRMHRRPSDSCPSRGFLALTCQPMAVVVDTRFLILLSVLLLLFCFFHLSGDQSRAVISGGWVRDVSGHQQRAWIESSNDSH